MLSDTKLKNLKPSDTRKRYADAEGLYPEFPESYDMVSGFTFKAS
jgi:hypothetical protein